MHIFGTFCCWVPYHFLRSRLAGGGPSGKGPLVRAARAKQPDLKKVRRCEELMIQLIISIVPRNPKVMILGKLHFLEVPLYLFDCLSIRSIRRLLYSGSNILDTVRDHCKDTICRRSSICGLWPNHDHTMTVLWPYYDHTMTVLWPYYDHTIAYHSPFGGKVQHFSKFGWLLGYVAGSVCSATVDLQPARAN